VGPAAVGEELGVGGKFADIGDRQLQGLQPVAGISVDSNSNDLQPRTALVWGNDVTLRHFDTERTRGQQVAAVVGGHGDDIFALRIKLEGLRYRHGSGAGSSSLQRLRLGLAL